MDYVFRMNGNREISFSASSDMAALVYAIENHSVSRDRAMPGEQLYRIDRVPVERPSKEKISQYVKVIQAGNALATNGNR